MISASTSVAVGHAALDVAIANDPGQRFTLRKGRWSYGSIGEASLSSPSVRLISSIFQPVRGAGSLNAPCTERLIQTCNQHLIVERFGKKADRASRDCPRSCFHFRKSGNENDREAMTLSNQFALQLYPIHARHLHVANQAIGVMQPVRFQERFGGCKLQRCIPKRSDEAHGSAAK